MKNTWIVGIALSVALVEGVALAQYDYCSHAPGTRPFVGTDASGNIYVAGTTDGTNFPTATGFQSAIGGGNDAYLIKISPDGSNLVYATYLGGANDEQVSGLVVLPTGEAVVSGSTTSPDFPIAGAGSGPRGATDVFVSRISAGGDVLEMSTLYGGSSDEFYGAVAVAPTGEVAVVGYTLSDDLLYVMGRFDEVVDPTGSGDCFIARLSADGAGGSSFGTYLGGSGIDECYAVGFDSERSIVVGGRSGSADFPSTPDFPIPTPPTPEGFVAKMSNDLTTMEYGSQLPGRLSSLTVDSNDSMWGVASVADDTVVTSDALQDFVSGGSDAYVFALTQAGQLEYATFIGGTSTETAPVLVADSGWSALAGRTTSTDFPDTTGGTIPAGESRHFYTYFHPSRQLIRESVTFGDDASVPVSIAQGSSRLFASGDSATFTCTGGLFGPTAGYSGYVLWFEEPDPLPEVSLSAGVTTGVAQPLPLVIEISEAQEQNVPVALSTSDLSIASVPIEAVILAGETSVEAEAFPTDVGEVTVTARLPHDLGSDSAEVTFTVVDNTPPSGKGCACATGGRPNGSGSILLVVLGLFLVRLRREDPSTHQ